MNKRSMGAVALLSSMLIVNVANAAPPVRVALRASGSAIYGGTAQSARTPIECTSLEGVDVTVPVSSTGATGKPQLSPIVCTHVIDSGSPLLFRALTQNQAVDATFTFTQVNPSTGQTQTLYTIAVTGGRIVSLRNASPSTLHTSTASEPATESFELTYTDITITYAGGVTVTYSTIVR